MNKNISNKAAKGNKNKKNIIIIGSIVIVIAPRTIFSAKKDAVKGDVGTKPVVEGDLTIVKSDVTDKAKFYGYQSNDTYMEVMAVHASDGTVRTALNTCRACNNSGRGYYVQEGDVLCAKTVVTSLL